MRKIKKEKVSDIFVLYWQHNCCPAIRHIPDVLYERLNSGAEQFPGYVCGVDGEAKSLCFSPHHIVKLVSKQRDSQHRNSMVHCLQQAVLSTMGDKETRSFVAWGKHKTEKASLLREGS